MNAPDRAVFVVGLALCVWLVYFVVEVARAVNVWPFS